MRSFLGLGQSRTVVCPLQLKETCASPHQSQPFSLCSLLSMATPDSMIGTNQFQFSTFARPSHISVCAAMELKKASEASAVKSALRTRTLRIRREILVWLKQILDLNSQVSEVLNS
jgi:hypothetical protein